MSNSEERIPTNLRTLKILEVLSNSEHPMTPTQINQVLELPKQTIHRLCSTLEQEGYLSREINGKRLQPSSRTKAIASGVLFNANNQIVLRQVLEGIATKVKETINLAVPGEAGMMYLKRVETDWAFRIQLSEGTHVPFYCTASGKVYLSSLPQSLKQTMAYKMDLRSRTKNTVVDPQKLLKQLSEISKNGYALDNEEFMEGMVAVAVPVIDKNSKYCASLAIHGPTQRMSLDMAREYREFLFEGAKALSGELFT